MTQAIAPNHNLNGDQEVDLGTLRSEIESQLWSGLGLAKPAEPTNREVAVEAGPDAFQNEVEAELGAEPGLDAGGISVSVRDGVAMVTGHIVTLTGEVDWQYQKIAAEHAVHRISGVVDLVNKIEVRSRRPANDS